MHVKCGLYSICISFNIVELVIIIIIMIGISIENYSAIAIPTFWSIFIYQYCIKIDYIFSSKTKYAEIQFQSKWKNERNINSNQIKGSSRWWRFFSVLYPYFSFRFFLLFKKYLIKNKKIRKKKKKTHSKQKFEKIIPEIFFRRKWKTKSEELLFSNTSTFIPRKLKHNNLKRTVRITKLQNAYSSIFSPISKQSYLLFTLLMEFLFLFST